MPITMSRRQGVQKLVVNDLVGNYRKLILGPRVDDGETPVALIPFAPGYSKLERLPWHSRSQTLRLLHQLTTTGISANHIYAYTNA